jgi:hypothetical protein
MWHCTRQESNQRNSEKWNENYRLLKRWRKQTQQKWWYLKQCYDKNVRQ